MQSIENDDIRVKTNKNFVAFQNRVGTQQTYESVLEQKNLLGASSYHCISRGLKPQRYYNIKERLKNKIAQKNNN